MGEGARLAGAEKVGAGGGGGAAGNAVRSEGNVAFGRGT